MGLLVRRSSRLCQPLGRMLLLYTAPLRPLAFLARARNLQRRHLTDLGAHSLSAMADSLSLTLRCWTASPLAPELATFDLPSLIALSACQLYARDRYQVAFDAEDLRLSGGDVRLVGLHEIVRGLDRRGDEPSTSDVAYLDLAMGRLGSLVLHSQVRRFDEFRLDCCLQALQRQLR